MKVDTHVLLMPDTNRQWWEECQVSFRHEPINLHLAEGVPGHIGKARAKAYQLGNAPYLSFIDPDDLIVPGAFQACIDTLDAHPEACGAYTDEVLIDPAGEHLGAGIWTGRLWNPLLMLEPKYMHHIIVMRREFVLRHLAEMEKWPNLAEFVLKGLLTQYGPWVHAGKVGYKWRVGNPVKASHKRFPVAGVYAARWRIIPLLYKAALKYQAKLSPTEEIEVLPG